jgi:hypothetical protein
MAKTKDKVADTADSMRPFVERAMRDERLREDVQSAFAVARKVYGELSGAKNTSKAATKLAGDKKLHNDLQQAVQDLRDAAMRLQGKKSSKKKSHKGRMLLAILALGALFNPVTGPETRRWLKELVTGGGGEFGGDYDSSTSTNGGNS